MYSFKHVEAIINNKLSTNKMHTINQDNVSGTDDISNEKGRRNNKNTLDNKRQEHHCTLVRTC